MAGRHVATPGDRPAAVNPDAGADTSSAVDLAAGETTTLLPAAHAAGTSTGNDGEVSDGVVLGADRSEALEDRP